MLARVGKVFVDRERNSRIGTGFNLTRSIESPSESDDYKTDDASSYARDSTDNARLARRGMCVRTRDKRIGYACVVCINQGFFFMTLTLCRRSRDPSRI